MNKCYNVWTFQTHIATINKTTILLGPLHLKMTNWRLWSCSTLDKKIMQTSNLWIATSLVNGLLRKIVSIFYKETLAPTQLPTFVVVNFYKVVVPPWDPQNPTYFPIPPIKRGQCTQIPPKMVLPPLGKTWVQSYFAATNPGSLSLSAIGCDAARSLTRGDLWESANSNVHTNRD